MSDRDTQALELSLEEFLTWMNVERGRARNTIAAYRRDLTKFSAFLASRNVKLNDAQHKDIEAYVASLLSSGLENSTVTRKLVVVRAYYQFAVAEGITSIDPSELVSRPRQSTLLPKALTELEVSSLLAAVSGSDALAVRDLAILELLYGTGARISELVGLNLSDVFLSDHVLRVFGKGAKERVVPLGNYAREALTSWLSPLGRDALIPKQWARKGDQDAVFLNSRGGRLSRSGAWRILRGYADQVDLAHKVTPHVLRHSCATHMLDHGADIRSVQELLGHASISTTQRYTNVSTVRLRQAYEAAHPRARVR